MVRHQECESEVEGLGNFGVLGLGLGRLVFSMLMDAQEFGVSRVLKSLKEI